jgi:hypothetical protein
MILYSATLCIQTSCHKNKISAKYTTIIYMGPTPPSCDKMSNNNNNKMPRKQVPCQSATSNDTRIYILTDYEFWITLLTMCHTQRQTSKSVPGSSISYSKFHAVFLLYLQSIMTWNVFRLQMQVMASKYGWQQSQITYKRWSCRLRTGMRLTAPHHEKKTWLSHNVIQNPELGRIQWKWNKSSGIKKDRKFGQLSLSRMTTVIS